jgi:hypothetical protein
MLDVVEQLPALEKILFYNFGEPFLHRQAISFLREVRRCRPEVIIHTSTNGLVLTDSMIEAISSEILVDRMILSIDGAREESYRKYRVNGSLANALSKMATLVAVCDRLGNRKRIEIIWQYILFEWNDTDEELSQARQLASALGVPLKWVFTHTAASKRFTDGSEAAARLFSKGDPYTALTCDSRMFHLWKHGGVSADLYLARLSMHPRALVGPAGARVAALLTVENLSSSAWGSDSGHSFRIGALLRSDNGRVIEELPGIPLPSETIRAGDEGTVLVDVRLPLAVGKYELFFDVVEDGVCWFSERSSPPLICPVRVVADCGGADWDYRTLVETTYRALLGCSADEDGLQYWASLLRDGISLERMLSAFTAAAFSDEKPSIPSRMPGLRAALLSAVGATALSSQNPDD